jgi:hypothetical protein
MFNALRLYASFKDPEKDGKDIIFEIIKRTRFSGI